MLHRSFEARAEETFKERAYYWSSMQNRGAHGPLLHPLVGTCTPLLEHAERGPYRFADASATLLPPYLRTQVIIYYELPSEFVISLASHECLEFPDPDFTTVSL